MFVEFIQQPTHPFVLDYSSNFMAGGAGVEYYFGYSFPHSDLSMNDWRSRDNMWTLSRYALDFFSQNNVPFQTMTNRDDLFIGPGVSAWCLANDDVYVVYLRDGGSSTPLRLPAGEYTMAWFDPRNGGDLQSMTGVSSSGAGVTIGAPPNNVDQDWTVLIRKE